MTDPFPGPDEFIHLVVAVHSPSKFLRTRIAHALEGHVKQTYEGQGIENIREELELVRPAVVFLDVRLFNLNLRNPIGNVLNAKVHPFPKILLMGTPVELERDVAVPGVDALLCAPFIPEMVWLRMRSVLSPEVCIRQVQAQVLNKMRKYSRIAVEDINVHFYKPFQIRAQVLDISYQGLKALTLESDPGWVGEEVQMQISGEGSGLNLSGRVMWVREEKVGIRFSCKRGADFSEFLHRMIQRLSDPHEEV